MRLVRHATDEEIRDFAYGNKKIRCTGGRCYDDKHFFEVVDDDDDPAESDENYNYIDLVCKNCNSQLTLISRQGWMISEKEETLKLKLFVNHTVYQLYF